MAATLIFWLAALHEASAQDHKWWAENVGWDGETHWSHYIISSPRFLGPNALPVPALDDGRIHNEHFLRATVQTHVMKGDFTLNPHLQLTYALVPDLISFDLFMTPVEYFRMSHTIRTERRTFHVFYGNQVAIGDLYLHTNIQLTRRKWDTRLRLGYKYATSGMQGLARFTDTPGYYFDLSAGRDLYREPERSLRLMIMAGLYVWQTNSDVRFQNDAILFGLGGRYQSGRWILDSHVRGYSGYLNNGDRPIVWRTELTYERERIRWLFAYQKGLHDYAYHTLEIGMIYKLRLELGGKDLF